MLKYWKDYNVCRLTIFHLYFGENYVPWCSKLYWRISECPKHLEAIKTTFATVMAISNTWYRQWNPVYVDTKGTYYCVLHYPDVRMKRTHVWWLKQIKRKKVRNNNCSAKPRRWWGVDGILLVSLAWAVNRWKTPNPLSHPSHPRSGQVNVTTSHRHWVELLLLVHRNPTLRTPRLYVRPPRY